MTFAEVNPAIEKAMSNPNWKPHFAGGNIKIGNMASLSFLPGDCDNSWGTGCKGTCTGCSAGCFNRDNPGKSACYAVKAINRYPTALYGNTVNTLKMREDPDKFFSQLDDSLSRKRKPFAIIRLNQAGEIESFDMLNGFILLAQRHPETIFYCYTKAYNLINKALLSGMVPVNLVILISVWHNSGIDTYKQLQHLDNVKAFVYMDGYDYSCDGLSIQTTCKAYTESGKMDHNITCDKCRKCFNNSVNHKVIGCYDH